MSRPHGHSQEMFNLGCGNVDKISLPRSPRVAVRKHPVIGLMNNPHGDDAFAPSATCRESDWQAGPRQHGARKLVPGW